MTTPKPKRKPCPACFWQGEYEWQCNKAKGHKDEHICLSQDTNGKWYKVSWLDKGRIIS